MGGDDLDRFSRYAFGTFDNRLHGYPSALVRYDPAPCCARRSPGRGARVRLDGFADTAACATPASAGAAQLHGFGAALEAPAPFRTLLSIEWGYGCRASTPPAAWTHVCEDRRLQGVLNGLRSFGRPMGVSFARNPGGMPMLSCWPAVLCLATLSRPTVAQQPTFKAGVDLVHFGVSVLDKQGKPVTGLKAEDFEVSENGKPQSLRSSSPAIPTRRRRCTSGCCSTPAAAWRTI
jgi:hypothetical protein